MLLFNHTNSLDPFTTLSFGSGDFEEFPIRSSQAAFVNWQAQSNAHALLINEAGRLVDGGVSALYALNAFAKTEAGVSLLYILGGIVDAEFTGTVTMTAPFIGDRESDALFSSQVTLATPFVADVEVDASFSSTVDLGSPFTGDRDRLAEFLSVVGVSSLFLPDDAVIDVWVFGVDSEAPSISRYSGFRFNSFAELNGRYYAAGDDGISELTGGTDEGAAIEGHIVTGRAAQGGDRRSRASIVYITGRSAGVLHCATIDEKGVENDYRMETPLGDIVSRERVKIGKGLKESFWQFKIGNEGGEDFELMNVGTLPDQQKRRVK